MYSVKIEQALISTIVKHEGKVRKAGRTPYSAHPIHVGFILQKASKDFDTVVAGFLHDVLEDTEMTEDDLREKFGEKICKIVVELTEDKSLEWKIRKQLYVEHLPNASVPAQAVSAADKLHNLSCILEELQRGKHDIWSAFKRGKKASLWFYQKV